MDDPYAAWGGSSSYSASPLPSIPSSATPFNYEELLQRLAIDVRAHAQAMVSEAFSHAAYVPRADFDTLQRRVIRLERQINVASDENDKRQDECHTLRREIEELRNRPDAPRVTNSHLKPAQPKDYDGVSKEAADEYLFQVENYARIVPFTSEETQILWAQGFLLGAARKWSQLITATTSTDPARFSWSAWRAAFELRYCSRDRSGTAIRKLEDLRQDDKTITEFVVEFEDLRKELTQNDRDGELVHRYFWNGLSTSTKVKLANHGYRSVDEAEEWLLEQELLWQDIEREKAEERRRVSKKSPFGLSSDSHPSRATTAPSPARPAFTPRPSAPSGSSIPAAASTSTSTSAPPPAPRDPNAMDVDKARRERRCRKCQGFGHLEKDCPSPTPFSRRGKAVIRDAGLEEDGQTSQSSGSTGFLEG